MGRIKTALFRFQPFSIKQKKILTWWLPESGQSKKNGIICDGSIRSGKTVCMSISFVMWSMSEFNGMNFAVCGKTIGSVRRNVIQTLKQMLDSRGYTYNDHRTDQMIEISYKGHTNFYYLFGGRDERSQDLIQGITLAGILLDEVALMPRSFVEQAMGRCSVTGSKMWFNCNPGGPLHWFKTEIIDRCEELGFLHLHFVMDDNLSLDPEIKQRYQEMYKGVFYKRYILGLWVAAEGIIYGMYEKALEPLYQPKDEEGHPIPARDYAISMDYGTLNAFAAGLWAQDRENPSVWHLQHTYYYSGRETGRHKTDDQYLHDIEEFIKKIPKPAYDRIMREGGIDTIVDPSAASFIAALRQKSNHFHVIPANNDVLAGIQDTATCLDNGTIRIADTNKETIQEFSGYVWEENEKVDRPIKINDHAMDMIRYFVKTKRLVRPVEEYHSVFFGG